MCLGRHLAVSIEPWSDDGERVEVEAEEADLVHDAGQPAITDVSTGCDELNVGAGARIVRTSLRTTDRAQGYGTSYLGRIGCRVLGQVSDFESVASSNRDEHAPVDRVRNGVEHDR